VGLADGFTGWVSVAANLASPARWPPTAGLSSGLAGSSAARGLLALLEDFFAIVRLASVRSFNIRNWHNGNKARNFKPKKDSPVDGIFVKRILAEASGIAPQANKGCDAKHRGYIWCWRDER
jgi:hypothetical protein